MDVEPVKMIDLVKNKTVATNIVHHERNKRVVDTGGAFYYMDRDGKYCSVSGLLPRLRKVFWPQSSIFKQMKGAKGGQKKRGGRSRGKFSGVIKGTKIHRELRDFIVFDGKTFKKVHGKLHPYSSRILKYIVDVKKWQPFLPEHLIYDEDLGLATPVDLICLTREGRLALLEFKTGYTGYFDNADGKMERPLHRMRNTPLNQATLQLMTSAQILSQKYEIPHSAMERYIMRIDDQDLEIIPIEEKDVKKIGPIIYKSLLNYNQTM